MNGIIEFLARNWFLLIFLLGPILSGLGRVFNSAARKAEEARRRAEARAREAELPAVRERQAALEAEAQRQRAAQAAERRQKNQRTAAKVRELLEGRPDVERLQRERAAERRRQREAEAAAAGSRPPALPPAPPPRRPQPTPPRTSTRPVQAARVDPHVGEALERRRAPVSGAVGRSNLGSLGGRARPRRRKPRAFRDLIQTENLPAMLIAQEILAAPVSLRDDRRMGGMS